jgi:transposase-like protein
MAEKIKRYGEALRRQVVQEYELGERLEDLRKKYGIQGTSTIQRWIKRFGKGAFRHEVVRIQTAEEANQVKQLRKQVDELEQALGQMTLEKLKLESILEEIKDEPGKILKKKKRDNSKVVE